jgi:RNA polymerase sigma-70 factor, ECF subfamily
MFSASSLPKSQQRWAGVKRLAVNLPLAPALISMPGTRAFPPRRRRGHRLAAAFHEAAASGDLHRLTQLLAQDAVLYSDGGGKRAAALKPIYGADRILRFLEGVSRKNTALQTMQVRAASINGLAGFVMREADGSVNTMAFECSAGRIVAIYVVRNPEKLRHVQR